MKYFYVFFFCTFLSRSFSQQATIINCDGNNDYISLPQVISSDFTIEYWARTTMTASTGSGSTAHWWSGSGIVDAEMPSWQYDFGTSLYGNKLAFGIGDAVSSTEMTLFSVSNINTGSWVHIAVNWTQSSGAMNLYINGVLENSGTGSTNTRTAPTAINIGRLLTGVNAYFAGDIDELRIWNYVRSQSQISGNMTCEFNVNSLPTGLLAYYTFDQGIAAGTNTTITSLQDFSGNNQNGTLSGFALTGTSSNWLSGSPVNGSLVISLSPASPSLCSGQTLTLTATGAPSFTWSNGSTSSSISVSPVITTSYAVTSGSSGCSGTSSVVITVSPFPNLIVSTSTTICSSGSASLSASGASSYTWQPVNSTNQTITVNPSVTTVYTVSGANSQGCVSTETTLVTVTNLPILVLTPSSPTTCSGAILQISVSGAYTYSWFPGPLTGSVISVNLTSPVVYTVLGSVGAGCTSTLALPVQVVANPTLTTISNPTTLCSGASATLTANGATSYTWLPGSLSGSMVIVNPSSTVIYTVTGETNGCKTSTTVLLSNALNASASSLGNITCTNSLTQLFASSNSSLNTMSWSGSGIIGSTSGTLITVNTAGIYTVLVTNTLTGCSSSPTVSVLNTIGPLTLTIVPSSSFACVPGPAINLLVGSSANYSWYPSASVSPSVGPLVSVNPSVTSTYTLVGILGVCSGSASITIPVDNVPDLVSASGNPSICEGASANLSVSGAQSYMWNPGNLITQTISVSPIFTTVYTVTGTNGNCSNTKQFSVSVNPLPVLSFSPTFPSLCLGESKTIFVSGATSYTWQTVAGNTNSITVTPLVSTIYAVSGTNNFNCLSTSTVMLNVNALPVVRFDSTSMKICKGASLSLTYSGADKYTLIPDLPDPDMNTVYILVGETNSCFGMDTLFVTVIDCDPPVTLDDEFFIPQGYSPDGDGINDYFVIKGLKNRVADLTIFNRWGEKVYVHKNYDNTWNGTANVSGLMFGKGLLPEGTYYYLLQFEDNSKDRFYGFVVIRN